MREFAVHYVDGPLRGHGSATQPDDTADGPPLRQRLPVPQRDNGLRPPISGAHAGQHAIYERRARNAATGEWEFALVRVG